MKSFTTALVEDRKFDELFALHKRVYDLDDSLEPDGEQCRPPSSVGSKEAKGALVKSRHTVNVFHEPSTGLTRDQHFHIFNELWLQSQTKGTTYKCLIPLDSNMLTAKSRNNQLAKCASFNSQSNWT